MTDLSIGVALAVLGGILNGSFASPTKYVKQWKWENIWPVWAFVGMIVVPWIMVFATLDHPLEFYRSAAPRDLALMFAFGAGFGLAQICFGLGLAAVGLALGFALMIGLTTVVGSLVPLVVLHPQMVFTPKGLLIIAGVAVIVIGGRRPPNTKSFKLSRDPLTFSRENLSSGRDLPKTSAMTCEVAQPST